MDHNHDYVLDHHDYDYVADHLGGGCSGIPDSPITIILPSLSGARMWELPLGQRREYQESIDQSEASIKSIDQPEASFDQLEASFASIDQ